MAINGHAAVLRTRIGRSAASTNAPPLVRPLEGNEFLAACSSASVVVILFHGERCRSCRAFRPKYARLARQYQGQAQFFRMSVNRSLLGANLAEVSVDRGAAASVLTLLPCVNVYVGGCCVRRLAASDEGLDVRLRGELDRTFDPDVLPGLLEQSSAEFCVVPDEESAAKEPAAAPLLALFCSLGLLSRAAALFDSLELAALWDGLEITTLT